MNKQRGSPIRWAGSKASSASQIMPLLDFRRPYIEPFCGSAAFFFKQKPDFSYLNDSNPALISFYDELCRNPAEVWKNYDDTPIDEPTYYEKRKEFNQLELGTRKASLFLYLNHYGFNGIFRTNRKGELNTPFGARKKIRNKMSLEEITSHSEALKGVSLYCGDFEDFLKNLSPEGCCIYMDPPYFTDDSRVFGEYGAYTFKAIDLQRLLDVAIELAASNNKIVISYKDCTEFRDLFRATIRSEITVQRNVGGFAGRRKTDQELVAIFQ
ncbi:DNA adenine methylase [Jannaschia donghaensis]|uniref:site-specific DNA-methyltransferase (adenine-specific) n=1 Tax=Jannaschia donghaensis TaxID=420998 RepID=A0A0M6YCM2_9RHOB|nr:Dam family site-specific DNA-(adenine-N6)-methyltransferase [Jannaschia donghaensis]CTQ48098.1 DNA adenine methylase [Jannaschia donghaensis]